MGNPQKSEDATDLEPRPPNAITPNVTPSTRAGGDEPERPVVDPSGPEFVQVPGYELLGQLGRGGMGVVYRARDTRLGRTVALKLLLTGQHALPEEVLRFQREARAAATLDHPNIVPIYEVGEHHGHRYFSMKLIEGGSLSKRKGEFQKDVVAAVRLVAVLARAVQYAHDRGILHRDLKPGNILLDAEGQPYVTDFGLAKNIEDHDTLTQSGTILGTPCYMSPEQAAGKKELSAATDVYSLGAILYELLAGRPPFLPGSTIDTLVAVRTSAPPRLRELVPALDPALEAICMKCLSKEPTKRPGSADLFRIELEGWLSGSRVLGPALKPRKWPFSWPKPKRLIAALVPLMLFVAGWLVFREHSDRVAISVIPRSREFVRARPPVPPDQIPPLRKEAPDPVELARAQMWKEKGHHYQESGNCKACHSSPIAQRVQDGAFDITLLTEYSVWRTRDKHSTAYATLLSENGKRIAEKLGKDVTKPETGCLNCHGTQSLTEHNQAAAKKIGREIRSLDSTEGVSCGACHGPSSNWEMEHAYKRKWREKLHAREKIDLGMRDLRDPFERARVCMSCHVGNVGEGKVLTDEMRSAGHAALSSNLAVLEPNQATHWREFRDTPALKGTKNSNFARTRFALIGTVVGIRELSRGVFDLNVRQTWPLKIASESNIKGRQQLMAKIKALREAPHSPEYDPAHWYPEMRSTCDTLIKELQYLEFDRSQCIATLRSLCSLADDVATDYQVARAVGSLTLIVAEELELKGGEADAVTKELEKLLNLQQNRYREDRLSVFLDVVREAALVDGTLMPSQIDGFQHASKEFEEYLKDISDTEKLKRMYTNQFFVILQLGITNKALLNELTKPSVAEKLQKLRNEVVVHQQKARMEYEPDYFRAAMKKLSKLVAEK